MDEPLTSRLAALALAITAAVVLAATSSGWLALFAVVCLAVSMWRQFVPVEFHIGARGLRQTIFGRSRTIRWSQIRVVEVRTRGIVLYPDAYFGPLRAMRGLYIPWRAHRDDVLRLVDFYASAVIARAGGPLPPRTVPADSRPAQQQAAPEHVSDVRLADDTTKTNIVLRK